TRRYRRRAASAGSGTTRTAPGRNRGSVPGRRGPRTGRSGSAAARAGGRGSRGSGARPAGWSEVRSRPPALRHLVTRPPGPTRRGGGLRSPFMSARGVLANSIPKAGTYLLKKCLSLLPGLTPADVHLDINLEIAYMRRLLAEAPPGAIVTGHLVHRTAYAEMLADEGYRSALIVRDPRDVAVSFVHYVTRTPEHYLHERYRAMGSDDERLM